MKNLEKIGLIAICCSFFMASQAQKTVKLSQSPSHHQTSLFKKGIMADSAMKVSYIQADGSKLNIEIKAPVTISVATKPEKWGYFQFPKICFKPNGEIQAKWNLTNDDVAAYGQDHFGVATSKDKGKTWVHKDTAVFTGKTILKNGDLLEVYTPKPARVTDLVLPKPVEAGAKKYLRPDYTYYRLDNLPEPVQGVYFKRLKKGETQYDIEKAKLIDPDAARYALGGLLPIVWWGDMHTARDGSLITGIYPGITIEKDGFVEPRSGVFFYRSTDNGHTWKICSRIPFVEDPTGDAFTHTRTGFTEPAFEILADGTYLCVMRTAEWAHNGPMYGSYSRDEGKTWTKPIAITGSGVLPRLLKLPNGIVVMSSGRPGVQLRFSTDASGMKWTDQFEMLPFPQDFKEEEPTKGLFSCGYSGLLPIGDDRFLIIYSDFAFKNENKENRKAIKVREVVVSRK